jgi:hypothetical protein
MVFEVLSEKAPAMARPEPTVEQYDDAVACSPSPTPARQMPPAVLAQLLRSAVALQAEGLLRTAGALSGVWGSVLDRTAWIERDARDLSVLTSAAVAAGASLPAGLDSGAGDPEHPISVVEGLLASHEALVRVLREIAGPSGTESISTESISTESISAGPSGAEVKTVGADADADPEPWRRMVRGVLDRREEEIMLLRAVGAAGQLPAHYAYRRGRPSPRY